MDVQLPRMQLLRHDEFPNYLHPRSPYVFLWDAILGEFRNLSIPFCSDEATMGPGGPLGPPAYTIISIYMLLQR